MTSTAVRGTRAAAIGNRAAGLLLVLPALIIVVLLFAFPLLKLIYQSFSEPHWGFGNYTSVISDPTTWRILLATLVIALESTVVCLVAAYPAAFLIASLRPARARLVLVIVLLPFWTSILAKMYAWLILLGHSGVINSTLEKTGLVHHPPDLLYNRVAVILGMTHYLLPFMILALYSSMVTIDIRLAEASSILGGSQLQTFLRVYLPLSLPGIFTGSLLVFILALGFYLTPAVLGGPHDTTIAVFIQQRVSELEFGQATAMATMLLVLVSILFFVYDRYFGFERLLRAGR
jgi:putative spermidine/putrescine transport system permease protein